MASAPVVLQLHDSVLLRGAAVSEVLHLVRLGAQTRSSRDGIPVSPGLARLMADLAAAVDCAVSPPRHEAPASSLVSGVRRQRDADGREDVSVSESGDWISTEEAAELLGVSRRQAQRLTPEIGCQKAVGGALVLARGAVAAYNEIRKAEGR